MATRWGARAMKTETKVTLGDFGADSVWFVSVGIPMGETVDLVNGEDPDTGEKYALEPCDIDRMVPFGWDLEGAVNEHGEWCWDGKGDPRDWNRNTVTAIKAFRS